MILDILQTSFSFVLILAPLVFVHELGHFLAAKMFGVRVPVFSLGFGPRLFGIRHRETDYRVSLIPLGGYVRMAGDEADENRTGASDEFLSKPPWQRFIVFVAGATFNIILAFVAMWMLFAIYGKPEVPEGYPQVYAVEQGSPAEAVGIQVGDSIVELDGEDVKNPTVFFDAYILKVRLQPKSVVSVVLERQGERIPVELPTGADEKDGSGQPGLAVAWEGSRSALIAAVIPESPAEAAGLQPGDRIVGANGRTPMSQNEVVLLLRASPEEAVDLEIDRAGEIVALTVTPALAKAGEGHVGVEFQSQTVQRSLSLGEAWTESVRINLTLSRTLLVVVKRLVTREVSVRTMSGPIGIAQYAREAITAGFENVLWLLGFFSLQLGILNLLPIPVLDGGHILLLGVEAVMRRELSERLKERVMQAGLLFLLFFMALVIYSDFAKTFF